MNADILLRPLHTLKTYLRMKKYSKTTKVKIWDKKLCLTEIAVDAVSCKESQLTKAQWRRNNRGDSLCCFGRLLTPLHCQKDILFLLFTMLLFVFSLCSYLSFASAVAVLISLCGFTADNKSTTHIQLHVLVYMQTYICIYLGNCKHCWKICAHFCHTGSFVKWFCVEYCWNRTNQSIVSSLIFGQC